MKRINLDHHSSTQMDEEVFSSMKPYFLEKWGSYVQPHYEGQNLIPELCEAFDQIKNCIKATDLETVIFTSSGVEAVHQVLDHVYRENVRESGRNHFITLQSDNAPILTHLKRLEKFGCHTTYVEVNDNQVLDPQALIDAITPRTVLITLSLAHGLTGVIQNLQGLSEICKQRAILLHLDVSYALGKIDLDFTKLKADFITFGGEVLHGPKSSGALIFKDDQKITPLILGGLEQNALRGGPLDQASLIGFAKACSQALSYLPEMSLEITRIRDTFQKKLVKGLENIEILFSSMSRLPNVLLVSFKNVHADALCYALNKRGVLASMGGGLFQKLSHLLQNMKCDQKTAQTTLSFTLSRKTTLDDVKEAAEIIIEEVNRLREMSQLLEVSHEG